MNVNLRYKTELIFLNDMLNHDFKEKVMRYGSIMRSDMEGLGVRGE